MTEHVLNLTVPAGVPFIDWTREFDAPINAVYRAHSDPALVKQWLGPAVYDMQIDAWDLRTGGHFRFAQSDAEGNRYSFNGVFHVARENELIIQTFEFEGYPDVVSIETLRFEDVGDGRTLLTGHSTYPSQEARDGMAQSDMEGGMSEGYERLDAVLDAVLDSERAMH
ncbi:polyketide cyclase [Cryobacterium melibiosiphilum]|uniref:Polyketide cyclase n=1 Tax=Cryobacterium melibiosiphilum TaxID=995039 RepID=A0A3A5MJS3_9MICO|nr:SRPBCC family protein [Cryobacterium melibiosiphilum]RJT89652.1 polyketide cyclase [Cryobacterium melibiosiphilum]